MSTVSVNLRYYFPSLWITEPLILFLLGWLNEKSLYVIVAKVTNLYTHFIPMHYYFAPFLFPLYTETRWFINYHILWTPDQNSSMQLPACSFYSTENHNDISVLIYEKKKHEKKHLVRWNIP